MNLKSFYRYVFLVLVSVMVFIGCGGGGSNGNPLKNNNSSNDVKEGKFTNVQGVYYKTSSGLEGTTDEEGGFEYHAGDDVSFYVGEAKLGTMNASTNINIFSFKNSILVSQILHSFDKDADSSNGYDLSDIKVKNEKTLKMSKTYSNDNYFIDIDEVTSYDEKYKLFLNQNKVYLFSVTKSTTSDFIGEVVRRMSIREKTSSSALKAIRGDYKFSFIKNEMLHYATVEYLKGKYDYRLNVAVANQLHLEIVNEISASAHKKLDESDSLNKEVEEFMATMELGLNQAFNALDALNGKEFSDIAVSVGKDAIKYQINIMDNEEYKPMAKLAATVVLDCMAKGSDKLECGADIVTGAMDVFIQQTIADEYPILSEWLKGGTGILADNLKIASSCGIATKSVENITSCAKNVSGAFMKHALTIGTKTRQIVELDNGQIELNDAKVALEIYLADTYLSGDYCKMLSIYGKGENCQIGSLENDSDFAKIVESIIASGDVHLYDAFLRSDVDVDNIKKYYAKYKDRAERGIKPKFNQVFNKYSSNGGYIDESKSKKDIESEVNIDLDINYVFRDDNKIDISACMNLDSKQGITIYDPTINLIDDRGHSFRFNNKTYKETFRGVNSICGDLIYSPYNHSAQQDSKYGGGNVFLVSADTTFRISGLENQMTDNYSLRKVNLYDTSIRRKEKESSVNIEYTLGDNYNYGLIANLNDQRVESEDVDEYTYLWNIDLPGCNNNLGDDNLGNWLEFTIPEECRNGVIPKYTLDVFDNQEMVATTSGSLEPFGAEVKELKVVAIKAKVVQDGKWFTITPKISGGTPKYDVTYNSEDILVVKNEKTGLSKLKANNKGTSKKLSILDIVVTDSEGNEVIIEVSVTILPAPSFASVDWINRWMVPYSPKNNNIQALSLGDTITQQWGIQNTSKFKLENVVAKWNSKKSNTILEHSKSDIIIGNIEKGETKKISLGLTRIEENSNSYDIGYYDIYRTKNGSQIPIKFPSSTKTVYLNYKFSTKENDKTPPFFRQIKAYSNDNSLVNGSFIVFQKTKDVKNIRVYFSPSYAFPSNDSAYIDVGNYGTMQSRSKKEFTFDASRWKGKRVYYKVEAKSFFDVKGVSTIKSVLVGGEIDVPIVTPTIGKISGITPNTATKDKRQTFVISGTNLPRSIALSVQDCSDGTVTWNSSTRATYSCIPRATGSKLLYAKMKSGGTSLVNSSVYKVQVSNAVVVDNKPTVKVTTSGSGNNNPKSSNFTLRVSATDDKGLKAIGYGVYRTSGGSYLQKDTKNVSGTSNSASFTINVGSLSDGSYKIKVVSLDTKNQASNVTYYYFQKKAPVVKPNQPTLSYPSSKSSISDSTPRLRWNSVSGVNFYRLYLASFDKKKIYDGYKVYGTNKTSKTLSRGKKYAWGIKACNDAGCSDMSKAFWFELK